MNVVRGRCLGAVGAITERPLTVGGAAEFAPAATLKPTMFGQPINDGPGAIESVFRAGRIVPIKTQVVDAAGVLVPNEDGLALAASCAVTVAVTAEAGTVGPVNEATPQQETSGTGSCLRYDATADQFIVGWPTKDLASGRYALRITATDAARSPGSREVTVALR
jgi:hypothetical protein